MDQIILQKTDLAAFKLRCCNQEKRYGITLGLAVKMRDKIRNPHLTEEQVTAMTPNELYALWCKRTLTKITQNSNGKIVRQKLS